MRRDIISDRVQHRPSLAVPVAFQPRRRVADLVLIWERATAVLGCLANLMLKSRWLLL